MSESLAKESGENNTESDSEAKEESTGSEVSAKSAEDTMYPDAKGVEAAGSEAEENKTDNKQNQSSADYELKVPEGSKLSQKEVEEIASYAKGQGFSKEQAEKLVERESSIRSRLEDDFADSQKKQLDVASEKWLESVKADNEMGGEKFEETKKLAHQAVKHFGSDGLLELLEKTKLGNHPEFLRVFSKIGRAMDSDSLLKGGSAPRQKKSIEDIFYPDESRQ